MLKPYRNEGLEQLLAALAEEVIAPAEGKVKACGGRSPELPALFAHPVCASQRLPNNRGHRWMTQRPKDQQIGKRKYPQHPASF